MRQFSILLATSATYLLAGCGGGDGEKVVSHTVSSGPKIFVTREVHSGDFTNDPTLSGSTAIQRADAFCNASTSKPSNHTYKALIVDGINRDAVTPIDWVLLPNTKYYQVFDNVLIDVTTSSANFASFFRSMPNPVQCAGCSSNGAWTGIDTGGTFSVSTNNCSRWGEAASVLGKIGTYGTPLSNGAFAFTSVGGGADCVSVQASLYCVQQ